MRVNAELPALLGGCLAAAAFLVAASGASGPAAGAAAPLIAEASAGDAAAPLDVALPQPAAAAPSGWVQEPRLESSSLEWLQEPPLDTASLATGPHAELHTRYRHRFLVLRFNVLDVRVRFGPETADRLRALVEEENRSSAVEDSAAMAAVAATDAFADLEFLRDVRLDQFVDATRENLDRAARAEIISEEDAREIGARLPEWFDFLRGPGIREGDRLLYRIRGDTLRTLFLEADGTVRLDQTDVGPERRRAVLGGYFAPRAHFRDGLLDSLFEEG